MPALPRPCVKVAVSFAISYLLLMAASRARADIPRLEAGAERGSVQKQMELATDYLFGRGIQRNEEKAAYWYEKAANSGDPAAQEEIGYFYQAGIGVPRDPSRAAHWFQLAASSGSVSAKVNLSIAYLWGLGVAQNPAFALQLFQEAAYKRDGVAAGYIGEMYFLGTGVSKDPAAAHHWFAIGAKMHDPHSEFRLADMLSAENTQAAISLARQLSCVNRARGATFRPNIRLDCCWPIIPISRWARTKHDRISKKPRQQAPGNRRSCLAFLPATVAAWLPT